MRCRGLKVEINECDQHEQATRKSVDEEFECDADPLFPTPDSSDEIGWYQGQFPENIENQPVEGCEYPDECSFH